MGDTLNIDNTIARLLEVRDGRPGKMPLSEKEIANMRPRPRPILCFIALVRIGGHSAKNQLSISGQLCW